MQRVECTACDRVFYEDVTYCPMCGRPTKPTKREIRPKENT